MGHDLDAYADLKSERDFERMMRNKFEQLAATLQSELAALKAAHAWIKTSERLPADDARVLALVVDDTGTEQVEIVDFLACVPAFLFADGTESIDDEIVMSWMPLPVRPR